MKHLVLFEDQAYRRFLPLVYWRPLQGLRLGRDTLLDQARRLLAPQRTTLWVREELAAVTRKRYGLRVNEVSTAADLLASARWIPQGLPDIAAAPCVGVLDDELVFIKCDDELAEKLTPAVMLDSAQLSEILQTTPRMPAGGWIMRYPWDLTAFNGDMLQLQWQPSDVQCLGTVHSSAHLLDPQGIHVGEGSAVHAGVVLDPAGGPIYLDEGSVIMPNAVVQGPAYIGARTVVSAGAWIRGNVSIGPGCKVGGELSASIFQGCSNKQHHGFVGDSYVAEWVNLGAGTTTSNLKNTYGTVRVSLCGNPLNSGRTFVGSFIGDFAKTGINQRMGTGSVIGFGTSIACSRMSPAFVPSFRFITDDRHEVYDGKRCLEVAGRCLSRRGLEITADEETLFERLPVIASAAESL